MRRSLLREAQLAARVLHPNIARLHEVGERDGAYYLAYEYVDGGTLEQHLKAQPDHRLAPADAVRLARAIAHGLTEIHRLHITHRDLKPANILLTRDGDVKIADLGSAGQALGSTNGSASDQSLTGTPLYMAPEQVREQADLDIRADLYSLGCVLYEMLTGVPPFAFPTSAAVLQAHQTMAPRPPRAVCPAIPDWLQAVCLKLLAKDRAQRYQTPQELLADLRQPS
jgi:serine/threonine-protein kinase